MENRILPSIQIGPFGIRAMLLLVIAGTLIAALASLAEGDDANRVGAANGFDEIWGTYHEEALDGDSYNSSIISLESQNNDTSTPVSIYVGNGYYASHPVTYNSAISSQTQLVNRGAATSMQHAVESAKGISGSSVYTVRESEYRRGSSVYSSTSSSQMMIDETVTEGRVHIGALQGGDASGWGTGRDGTGSSTSAWKNPSIEIDEEYIGTYHISKNITFSKSERRLARTESWLNCCYGTYFDILLPERASISSDDVFSYVGK